MSNTFKPTILAFVLSLLFAAGAPAGQFEDGIAAQRRGDYATAHRLLRPLADRGDERARWALGEAAPPSSRTSRVGAPGGMGGLLISAMAALAAVAIAVAVGLMRRSGPGSSRRGPPRSPQDLAKDWTRVSPEEAFRLRREMDLGWVPGPGGILLTLHDLKRTENSFSARADGEHDGRVVGFRLRWTMYDGPVALLEWWRTGDESDALIDFFAEVAGISRGANRFEDYVRSSAIILDASPQQAPFERLRKINAKVVFDLAKGQPEMCMDFDFGRATGTIDQKDLLFRTDLVHAFHHPDKAVPIDEDDESIDEEADEPVEDDAESGRERERLAAEQQEFHRMLEWDADHPWKPIVFRIDALERTDASFALHARGDHDGRRVGFRLRLTHAGGRFAVCEWWRTGDESDALLDILAAYTTEPPADRRCDDHVTAQALIVAGSPATAPFAQLTVLEANVLFDRAPLCPAVDVRFDFRTNMGQIIETNTAQRWALARALLAPPASRRSRGSGIRA